MQRINVTQADGKQMQTIVHMIILGVENKMKRIIVGIEKENERIHTCKLEKKKYSIAFYTS